MLDDHIGGTEIGGQAKAEGRQVDQQKLQSAYDYARKAVETSQLSEATALVKEFRSSDAYLRVTMLPVS